MATVFFLICVSAKPGLAKFKTRVLFDFVSYKTLVLTQKIILHKISKNRALKLELFHNFPS